MDTKNKIKLTGFPQIENPDYRISVPDRFENRISYFQEMADRVSQAKIFGDKKFSIEDICPAHVARWEGFGIEGYLSDLNWRTAIELLKVVEEKSTEDLPLEVWVIDGEVRLVTHDGGTRIDLTDQWLDEEEKITREFTSKIFG
jgi:hypothetical protein